MIEGIPALRRPQGGIENVAGTDVQAFGAVRAGRSVEPGSDSQRCDVGEPNGPLGASVETRAAADAEPPVDDILDAANRSHRVWTMLPPPCARSPGAGVVAAVKPAGVAGLQADPRGCRAADSVDRTALGLVRCPAEVALPQRIPIDLARGRRGKSVGDDEFFRDHVLGQDVPAK